MMNIPIDIREVITRAMRYIIEALAITIAAYYLPRRTMQWEAIAVIAATGAAALALLDTWAPTVAEGARKGSGFGIGMQYVGALPY